MSPIRFLPVVIFIYLFSIQSSIIECRPRTQRIVIHGHEWTVPNEPGWDEVLREAEPIRNQLLSNCASTRECRLAAEKLRRIFLKYPIASKYYDDSAGNMNPDYDGTSIFKWG